ncbi:MAG: hypothetical protein ABIU09_02125, partial [Pyrinomonadaceae bacterium]
AAPAKIIAETHAAITVNFLKFLIAFSPTYFKPRIDRNNEISPGIRRARRESGCNKFATSGKQLSTKG